MKKIKYVFTILGGASVVFIVFCTANVIRTGYFLEHGVLGTIVSSLAISYIGYAAFEFRKNRMTKSSFLNLMFSFLSRKYREICLSIKEKIGK